MARKISKRQPKNATLGLQTDCTALYIRVSTTQQADEGYSLDAQRAKLDAYCVAMGWAVAEGTVFIDAGESGSSTDRPAFQRMLAAAHDGAIKRIVAVKLDRVARNVRAFLELVDTLTAINVDLVLMAENFDTGTPSGKFALTMFAAMAELERATISERMMTGKAQKAKIGGFNGSPTPYGYDYNDGEFTINSTQAGIVGRIFTAFVAGEGLTAIATALHEAGVPTATGGTWAGATVRYIVTNGAYAGLAQWGVHESEGTYPAIITAELYERAMARLATIKPGPKPKRTK